jgi:hypothetical protein
MLLSFMISGNFIISAKPNHTRLWWAADHLALVAQPSVAPVSGIGASSLLVQLPSAPH